VHTGDVTFMSSSSPDLASTNICVIGTKPDPSVLLQLRNIGSAPDKLWSIVYASESKISRVSPM
jgi:hypothetical protein